MKNNEKKYEEKIIIKYYDNSNIDNHFLSIDTVMFEQQVIYDIYKRTLLKNNFFKNQNLFINFAPGSSKIELLFSALIEQEYFEVGTSMEEVQIIESALWSEIDSFENGLKRIKPSKIKSDSYSYTFIQKNSESYIEVIENDKIIWKGKEVIFKLILSKKTQKKQKAIIKNYERALLTQKNRSIELISSEYDGENLIEKFNSSIKIENEILDKISKMQEEIDEFENAELKNKDISNYKMNIIGGNIWIPEIEKDFHEIRVIPFGHLSKKSFKINVQKPIPKIIQGTKNFIEADVTIEYFRNEIKEIKINKIHKIECNKNAYKNSEDRFEELLKKQNN